MVELYPFQQELLERSLSALTPAKARVMLQLPTGAGKTEIAGALLKELLSVWTKAAWLTHREELAEQTVARLRQNWSIGAMSLTEGWYTETPAPHIPEGVAVLKAQTVTRRNKDYSGVWRSYSDRDLLVIDEAHHAPASGWERAIEQWPGRVLGLTATPWRLDKNKGFKPLFKTLIPGPQTQDLQDLGFLAPSRVFAPPPSDRIVGGNTFGSNGDYTPGGIEKATDRPIMTTRAVLYWQEKASNRPTIAYAVSVDHARNLACEFNKAGVRAAVILGETERRERDEAIAGFRDGGVEVLVNVAVATEGFDLPDASCVMITRPTQSLALYLQMVGRGLRPKADGGDSLILDLAGNAEEHGLPETVRRWSLDPRGEQPAGDPPVSYCPECGFTTHPANHECPNCHVPLMKKCPRCGVHRPWSAWSSTGQCSVEHEAVCDRCHVDKHVELGLSKGNIRSPERDALVALYESTNGKTWMHNSNWMTEAPLSEWHGITTDHNGHVIEVGLRFNKLTGPIPAELANLDSLRTLDLRGNQLAGPIPTELAQLTNLEVLHLNGNRLTGPVPTELAQLTNLEVLHLNRNRLTGPVPSELAQLANLTELDLGSNQLTGPVPTELAQLTNLEVLHLNGNQLTGPVPSELAQLANLTELDLGSNQLTGPVPSELAQLTSLMTLTLDGNQLTGPVPTELAQLSNLRTLRLGRNQLTGPVPTELAQLTNLHTLDLGGHQSFRGNQLTGHIPTELAQLANLTTLRLDDNQLTGHIPTELAQLANLTTLRLDGSQLTGHIPTELAQLANLTTLRLDGNQLTGHIPTELAQLTNLTTLRLDGNQLSGPVPTELAQLASLMILRLDGNQLTGPVPPQLAQLTNLHTLDLGGNRLTGPVPPQLAQLTNLHTLDLGGNRLTGPVPPQLAQLTNLTTLLLDDNRLTGPVPPQLAQLTNLTTLLLDGNRLTGPVPPQLAQLATWKYRA